MIDQNKNKLPLDLSYLQEMSGDSAEFMLEMLDAFLKQTPIYIEDLAKAIAAEDWKATSECAHKIKPTFYYVGRADVRDHMQEMETNARQLENLDLIPKAFQEVQDFVTLLYNKLEEAKIELQKRV